MRKIFLFMHISLDGYFEAPEHDISWARNDEGEAFSLGKGEAADAMLFGRRTYEMMKNFWPTPQAAHTMPEIARFMNENLKIVASRQPFEPGWSNVRVISGDVVDQVKKIKEGPGKTIAIFGSNALCVSLMPAGLIDEFQIVINPVVLGEGSSLFKGLPKKAELTLVDTHRLKTGQMLLTYQPTG
jgi:dihydrofolate reductase